jgi:hypothetical protein
MIPTAPPVLDPGGANRCNSFEFSRHQAPTLAAPPVSTAFFGTAAPHVGRDTAAARRRFNELFGEGT